MEAKGLRVNMKKTKFMVSGAGMDMLKDSGKFPCALGRKRCRSNCIACSQCNLWVHKKYSGIKRRLMADPGYVCHRYRGEARPIDGRPMTSVSVDVALLDVGPSFCYLGDMLSAGDGCDLAINVRFLTVSRLVADSTLPMSDQLCFTAVRHGLLPKPAFSGWNATTDK